MRGLGYVKLSPAPSPPVQEQRQSGHAGLRAYRATQTSLLTSSQGSGRCLWETQRVRVLGVGAIIPTSHLSESSHLASLTSHFDGHSLLGADQVDDFLVGTGGDGVAIDPDNLIPYLGTERWDKHGGGCQTEQKAHYQLLTAQEGAENQQKLLSVLQY